MKKRVNNSLLITALFTTVIANAQDIDLTTPATTFSNQIKGIFPIVAGILFIVVALINLGHFTKEGGDWKKGLTNIIIFVAIVGVIAGLYSYVTSISL
jgi:uncharacterized membrane protein